MKRNVRVERVSNDAQVMGSASDRTYKPDGSDNRKAT